MYPPPYNEHLEISIFKVIIAAEFHLQLLTLKAGVKLNILIQVNQIKRCMYTSDLTYRKLLAKPKTV